MQCARVELPKWVVAARTIFEFDPYFNIEIYEVVWMPPTCATSWQAVMSWWMHAILWRSKHNCAWRPCRRVSLVMDTNDRGMLDVERYDAQRDDGIYTAASINTRWRPLPKWSNGPGGAECLCRCRKRLERGRMSLPMVGSELVSWPQTYTGVAAGGAHAAEACRRLALEKSPRCPHHHGFA